MKVKAIAMGYDGFARVKPGTVFDMPDEMAYAAVDKDGNKRLPRWVVPADAEVEDKGLKLPGHKIVRKPKSGVKMEEKKADSFKSTGDEEVI